MRLGYVRKGAIATVGALGIAAAGAGLLPIRFGNVQAQTQAPAQTPAQRPTPTPSPSPKVLTPEEQFFEKMRTARNDPAQTVELLVKLVTEFPEYRGADTAGYSFATALKKQVKLDKDPAKLQALADRYVKGTATAAPQLRVRSNGAAIRAMLDNGLAPQAAEMARQTIALLNQQEYVAFSKVRLERDMAAALKANPKYKPMAFVEADWVERFVADSAAYHTALGNALLKQNDMTGAEASFLKAYELTRDAPAAAGLATIREKQGKDAEALEYLSDGVLTGKLTRAGLDQFETVYRRTHGGKLDGSEEYLDARYRKNYRSPLKSEKVNFKGQRSGHAVLAEFFTGAGCIPCMPYDYTFETALEDYTRRDLVLLVYHWHAPTLDPMGNRSVDSRLTYYNVMSAPTLVLDGEKFKVEETGDTRGKTQAIKAAGAVQAGVRSMIDKGLELPLEARIKASAERAGKTIKASTVVEPVKDALSDVTLQIALVEEEIHYSGENGLRFHPMVVRNLAKSAAGSVGFAGEIARSKTIEHTFDLDAIMDENRRYYTEWPVERNKEVNGRIGGEADFDVGKFKEERYVINPEKLYVVAFLQDNKTKRIIQSTFVKVSGSRKQPTTAGTR